MPKDKERKAGWSATEQDDTLYITTPPLHGRKHAHTTFKKLARTLQKAGATPEEIRALRQAEKHETAHQEDVRCRSKKRGATPIIEDAWFNFPPNTNTREAINSAKAPTRRAGMKSSPADKAIASDNNFHRQNRSPGESNRHDDDRH